MLFERTDDKRQIVLIEWTYTESYGGLEGEDGHDVLSSPRNPPRGERVAIKTVSQELAG